VISSIAFGIFAIILSMGFMNGMNRQMVENTIRTSLGHMPSTAEDFSTPRIRPLEALHFV